MLRGPGEFGALSALLTQGPAFLAATDTGHFVEGRQVLEGGRLVGVSDVQLIARVGLSGVPVRTKREGDAEALAIHEGKLLVLVEGSRNVFRYPLNGLSVDPTARPTPFAVPPAVRHMGRSGIEALATLPDGRLLFIAEGRNGEDPTTPAFLMPGGALNVARRDGYAITGADALPGGDVLIVERRWRGGIDVAMRVRRIGVDALRPGALADGPVLLEAGFSAEIDNMEGISAEEEGQEIIVTLVSDDNHNFLQRTLLLRFVVSDPLPRPRPAPIESAQQ